jgi:hypothetical protein
MRAQQPSQRAKQTEEDHTHSRRDILLYALSVGGRGCAHVVGVSAASAPAAPERPRDAARAGAARTDAHGPRTHAQPGTDADRGTPGAAAGRQTQRARQDDGQAAARVGARVGGFAALAVCARTDPRTRLPAVLATVGWTVTVNLHNRVGSVAVMSVRLTYGYG